MAEKWDTRPIHPSVFERRLRKLACFVDVSDGEEDDHEEDPKQGGGSAIVLRNGFDRKDDSYDQEFALLLSKNDDGTRKSNTRKSFSYRVLVNVRSMYNGYIRAVRSTCPRPSKQIRNMRKLFLIMVRHASHTKEMRSSIQEMNKSKNQCNEIVPHSGTSDQRSVLVATSNERHNDDSDGSCSLPPPPPPSSPPPSMKANETRSARYVASTAPSNGDVVAGKGKDPISAGDNKGDGEKSYTEEEDVFLFDVDDSSKSSSKSNNLGNGEESLGQDSATLQANHHQVQPSNVPKVASSRSNGSASSSSMSSLSGSSPTRKLVQIALLPLVDGEYHENPNENIYTITGSQIVVAVRDEQSGGDGNPTSFADFNADVEIEILRSNNLMFGSDSDTNEMTVSSSSSLSSTTMKPSLGASSVAIPSDEKSLSLSMPSDENETSQNKRPSERKDGGYDYIYDKENKTWLKFPKVKRKENSGEKMLKTHKKESKLKIFPFKIREYCKSMKWFVGKDSRERTMGANAGLQLSEETNIQEKQQKITCQQEVADKQNQEQPPSQIQDTKQVGLILDRFELVSKNENYNDVFIKEKNDTPLLDIDDGDDSTFDDVYYDNDSLDSPARVSHDVTSKVAMENLSPSDCCNCQNPCNTQPVQKVEEVPDIDEPPSLRRIRNDTYLLDEDQEVYENTVVEVAIGEDEFVYDEALFMSTEEMTRSTTMVTREKIVTAGDVQSSVPQIVI